MINKSNQLFPIWLFLFIHCIGETNTLLQVGVEQMHKDSKYVLFLDDDVRLHPGTIGALTAEMEKNPDVYYYPIS